MKEEIKVEDTLPIKGWVKVQLFDAQTGNLKHEQEGPNFLTHMFKDIMKGLQTKQLFMNRMGGVLNDKYIIASTSSTFSAVSGTSNNTLLYHIYLTGDSRAENPATQQQLIGNIIGMAVSRSATNIINPLYGTLNEAETKVLAALDKVSFVFDFATDRANGTFNSIYFGSSNPGGFYSSKVTAQYVLPTDYQTWSSPFCDDANYIYYTYSSRIYKIDKSTNIISEVSTSAAPSGLTGIAFDGTSKFYCKRISSSTIYIYDTSTNEWTSWLGSGFMLTSPLNTQIYLGYYYECTSTTIRRFDLETNTVQERIHGYTAVGFFVSVSGLHVFTSNTNHFIAATLGGVFTLENKVGLHNALSSSYRNAGIYGGKIACIDARGPDNYVICTYDLDMEDGNVASRRLLTTPVTKTASDVMKITYTFQLT